MLNISERFALVSGNKWDLWNPSSATRRGKNAIPLKPLPVDNMDSRGSSKSLENPQNELFATPRLNSAKSLWNLRHLNPKQTDNTANVPSSNASQFWFRNQFLLFLGHSDMFTTSMIGYLIKGGTYGFWVSFRWYRGLEQKNVLDQNIHILFILRQIKRFVLAETFWKRSNMVLLTEGIQNIYKISSKNIIFSWRKNISKKNWKYVLKISGILNFKKWKFRIFKKRSKIFFKKVFFKNIFDVNFQKYVWC